MVKRICQLLYMAKKSKEHEVTVLESVFRDSKEFFEGMGYTDYVFKSNDGNCIPDGTFIRGASIIWVEHTQARLNYGEKGSILPGLDGFCKDVQRELLKEGLRGCICFDISSVWADKYFSSSDFKSEILNIARGAISSSDGYADEERDIYVKHCSPEECCSRNLEDYKGLRVTISGLHNLEFCRIIPRSVYDACVSIKERKYQKNTDKRDENWLFIEEPWRYTFRNDLPNDSNFFDKIFIVERSGKDGREVFLPRLSATRMSG